MKTEWDYTNRASTYDQRADYASKAIDSLVTSCNPNADQKIADIGAGTGKLTLPLLQRGLKVDAVEPNDAMRSFGKENTKGSGSVKWSEGTGEETGLSSDTYWGCFFGSSFNVVDQAKALTESRRLLQTGGLFACMWNHRDLEDPLQKEIEAIFSHYTKTYDYGKRREDPSGLINKHPSFSTVECIEERFVVEVNKDEWVDAWNSHATVARQIGETNMNEAINSIKLLTQGRETINVPYHTRIWHSKAT